MEGDAAGIGRMSTPPAGRPSPRGARAREGFGDPGQLELRDPLVWNPADQQRVFQSFDWVDRPSTTQVLLAQEELWVYGLFCDEIKRMNEGAKGAFDAAITSVDELAVGYPAAEEKPAEEPPAKEPRRSLRPHPSDASASTVDTRCEAQAWAAEASRRKPEEERAAFEAAEADRKAE